MISLSNLTVSTKAAVGAVIGTVKLLNASDTAMNANDNLSKGSAGFFAVSGSNLVTVNPLIPPGYYSVRVRAVGTKTWWSETANFVITVTAT
jgi:hypothetical protein